MTVEPSAAWPPGGFWVTTSPTWLLRHRRGGDRHREPGVFELVLASSADHVTTYGTFTCFGPVDTVSVTVSPAHEDVVGTRARC